MVGQIESTSASDSEGRTAAMVIDFDQTSWQTILLPHESKGLHVNISSDLGFSDFASNSESPPNVVQTENGSYGHGDSGKEHQKRPSGHIPLGLQIAFSAFVLISGLYYSNYAFLKGSTIEPSTGVFYLISGMFCIGIGIGFILTGLFP